VVNLISFKTIYRIAIFSLVEKVAAIWMCFSDSKAEQSGANYCKSVKDFISSVYVQYMIENKLLSLRVQAGLAVKAHQAGAC
jgi:hypothetical protein